MSGESPGPGPSSATGTSSASRASSVAGGRSDGADSRPGEDPPGPGGFGPALARATSPQDVATLAAVPVLLLGVYALPEATRRALVFEYTDPGAVTALSAHYVHFDPTHLAGNVIGYCLLASACYLLAALAGRLALFRAAFVTFLLAFPPVLSALNLAVPRAAVGYGFSGVNVAFAGLLPLLLTAYVGRRLVPAVRVRHAPGLFLLSLAPVPLLALPPSATAFGLAAGAGLGAVGYAASFRRRESLADATREWADRSTLRSLLGRPGWSDLFVLAAGLLLAFPFAAFPADVRTGGTVLNLYVHLLGFCLAFIGPYLALELGAFGETDDPAT